MRILQSLLGIPFLCTLLPAVLSGQYAGGSDTLSLNEALDRELLKVRISGVVDPQIHHEVIDGDGVHYGKCMQVIVQGSSDSLFHVRLDNGMVLIPADSALQDMIVTHDVILPISPNATYISRFYAMCGQMHDASPYLQAEYTTGPMADSTVRALSRYFQINHIQNKAGQHALWVFTDQAGLDDLTKYGADSLSLVITRTILNDLNIRSTIGSAPLDRPEDAELFIIPKRNAYWGLGGILMALAVMLYLMRRGKAPAENA